MVEPDALGGTAIRITIPPGGPGPAGITMVEADGASLFMVVPDALGDIVKRIESQEMVGIENLDCWDRESLLLG
jgi:hypothetical protein